MRGVRIQEDMPLLFVPCITYLVIIKPTYPWWACRSTSSYFKKQHHHLQTELRNIDHRVRTACATFRKRHIRTTEKKPFCASCEAARRRAISGSHSASSSARIKKRTPPREDFPFSGPYWRQTSLRHVQAPLYHHFVTTTA